MLVKFKYCGRINVTKCDRIYVTQKIVYLYKGSSIIMWIPENDLINTIMDTITIKDIKIVDYSEKSIAIQGETKKIKDLLKSMNCHYNKYLRGGAGWVTSKKKRDLVTTRINEYFDLTK